MIVKSHIEALKGAFLNPHLNFHMPETGIPLDSAIHQHIRFNLGIKGALHRATPGLDTKIEPPRFQQRQELRFRIDTDDEQMIPGWGRATRSVF